MSKKNKVDSKNTKREKLMPQGFFHTIGIKPMIDPNVQLFYRKVRKAVGPAIADAYYDRVVTHNDAKSSLHIAFSHLELSKLWYGNAIIETSRIAAELQTLDVPGGAKILDIGGGPGVLAFWMTKIWEGCQVTVADRYSKVGREWAQEIGNNQVTFIDSLLPDLVGIPDDTYDVAVLSRVLGYLVWLNMPNHILAYSMDDFLNTPDGGKLQKLFAELVDKLRRVMLPDGHIVIINEWNYLNVLLIAKLFEQNGYYIDPNFFLPDRVSENHSIIAFSPKMKDAAELNFTEGMSAFMTFPQVPLPFMGSLAEALRKTFDDGLVIAVVEYEQNKNNLRTKHELIIKCGLALLYATDTFGRRNSMIYPSVKKAELLEKMYQLAETVDSDDSTILINKLLAA